MPVLYGLVLNARKRRISAWALEDTKDFATPVSEKVFLTGSQVQQACLDVVCVWLLLQSFCAKQKRASL